MSDQNISVINIFGTDSSETSTQNSPKSKETTDDTQSSHNCQEYEINAELEELTNKIHSEIAKREESNLKHNIFYVPPTEESNYEDFSEELKLLKDKIINAANNDLSNKSNNSRKNDYSKELPIVLKYLLKYKLNITKKILSLTCLQDVLKCKVKFQENLDSIVFDLNADYKSLNENTTFYRQQWRTVVVKLNKLKNLQTSLDLKIKSVMLDMNVTSDDYEFLKHTIDLKTLQHEFQAKHINYLKQAFHEAVIVKDKFIHIMAQMLDMYNNILKKNSLLTEQMSNSYSNMIRTAQILGMNSLMVDEPIVSGVLRHDSGFFNEKK